MRGANGLNVDSLTIDHASAHIVMLPHVVPKRHDMWGWWRMADNDRKGGQKSSRLISRVFVVWA